MNMEIERRYLIRRPDEAALAARPGCAYTDISQTYLRAAEGTTERVRRRGQDGQWRYSHTIKRRVSLMSHIEDEREISPDEYARLLRRADPARRTIEKRRYTLPWEGHVFEIDVYPFWKHQAIMEVELKDEGEAAPLPPEVTVLRELTGDRVYSNAALALSVPREDA